MLLTVCNNDNDNNNNNNNNNNKEGDTKVSVCSYKKCFLPRAKIEN